MTAELTTIVSDGSPSAPAEPILSVRDLTTYFEADEGVTRAVDGVSLDVYEQRTLCIVGESGCGKSVTARSVLRLVQPPGRIVAGEVLLRMASGRALDIAQLGERSAELRSIRGGDIGLVFQEPMASFSPVHTIGDQLREAVRLHTEASADEAGRRIVELLRMVGVPDPEARCREYPWQLSGGIAQRCMIAMALAGDPRLLIADEPTTALDVTTQAQILALLNRLRVETGMGLILITHDLGVVAEMADDVAVMYLGKIVEYGTVQEVFAQPRHPYTRGLMRSIPSLVGPVRTGLPTIDGSVPHPFDRPSGCAFHTRCPVSVPGLCSQQEPSETILADGRRLSCHYASGMGLTGDIFSDMTLEARSPAAATTKVPAARPMLLEVADLKKWFPVRGGVFRRGEGNVRAVDGVSFEIRQGETLALVGESGSGKSTTARCIVRAVDPDSGSIRFRMNHLSSDPNLVDIAAFTSRQMRSLRSDIQMIFQDPYTSLNPRMTVLDIVGEPLRVHGVKSRSARIERVAELLDLVGLRSEYMRRYPHAFSGGQRQRIGIARALALNPRLVVADEPTSSLDVSVQAQTLNLLLDLQSELDLTYLFVSHDLSVVRHMSDRIAVMYVGQLVEMGTTEEVLTQPKHPYTSTLLGSVPVADPTAREGFVPPKGEVASPINPPSGCYFHPRCPFATERCQEEAPAWRDLEDGRKVRCHYAEDVDLPGLVRS